MPDIDLDFPRDIREKLIVRGHRALRARARRARRELRDVPLARRDPRRREGARPPVRRARAARAALGRLEREAGGGGGRAAPRRRAEARVAALARIRVAHGRDRRPPAPRLAAPGRDDRLDAAADRARPGAAGGDGRTPALPVGQGLVLGRGVPQDRPARARDALRGRGLRRADRAHARRGDRPLADPLRRRGGLRRHPARGHDRRVPDREPRADAEPPADEAGEPRRHHRAGRARPAGADPGEGGAPLHRRAAAPARRPVATSCPVDHELLREPLRSTFGVVVFQDQVLEVAIALAGFRWARRRGCAAR